MAASIHSSNHSSNHYKVLILGGGSGGISVASRLKRVLGNGQVGLIDPAKYHYYQPLWTLVGAGVVPKEKSRREQSELIPKGVAWIQDKVQSVDPNNRIVTCERGVKISNDFLVVATGLKLDFQSYRHRKRFWQKYTFKSWHSNQSSTP